MDTIDLKKIFPQGIRKTTGVCFKVYKRLFFQFILISLIVRGISFITSISLIDTDNLFGNVILQDFVDFIGNNIFHSVLLLFIPLYLYKKDFHPFLLSRFFIRSFLGKVLLVSLLQFILYFTLLYLFPLFSYVFLLFTIFCMFFVIVYFDKSGESNPLTTIKHSFLIVKENFLFVSLSLIFLFFFVKIPEVLLAISFLPDIFQNNNSNNAEMTEKDLIIFLEQLFMLYSNTNFLFLQKLLLSILQPFISLFLSISFLGLLVKYDFQCVQSFFNKIGNETSFSKHS